MSGSRILNPLPTSPQVQQAQRLADIEAEQRRLTGISYQGESFLLPLGAGWINFVSAPAKFRKDFLTVFLEGIVQWNGAGTSPSGSLIGTLPAGFLPALGGGDLTLGCTAFPAGSATPVASAITVEVNPAPGLIEVYPLITFTVGTYLILNGLSFRSTL